MSVTQPASADHSFAQRMEEIIQRVGGPTALARKAGVSQAVVHKYRNAVSTPDVPRLIALAQAAEVRVEWLATGAGPKEPGPDALIAQLAAEGELVPVDDRHYPGMYARRGTSAHARLATLKALTSTATAEAHADLTAVIQGAPAIAKGFGWPINGDQISDLILRAHSKLRERPSPGGPVNAGELIRAVVDAYEELRGKKR